MGRLSGFKYREIIKRLKRSGFEFDRQAAGSHEIWFNSETNRYTTVPNHSGDMPEGTLPAVLKESGITPDEVITQRISCFYFSLYYKIGQLAVKQKIQCVA